MKDVSEANGGDYADGGQSTSRETDVSLDASTVSKSAALLANVQALLGCSMEEVLVLFAVERVRCADGTYTSSLNARHGAVYGFTRFLRCGRVANFVRARPRS